MSIFSEESLSKVFHAYDIRGTLPDQLNAGFFEQLGRAFVTYLSAKKIVVGYDIRPESKEFSDAFIRGAKSLGCDVINIGMVATEMMYFATGFLPDIDGGATITASHNPAGWNGCKLVGKNVKAISKDEGLFEIKNLMITEKFTRIKNDTGSESTYDIYPEFKTRVLEVLDGIEPKALNIVVDAGNGIGGHVFDYVFGDLPLNVTKMYFEIDGNFPNHVPDPLKEENVIEIKHRVQAEKADIGIAIDGDADRVFFIDSMGRNPSGVYTGGIFARYMLAENPGSVILHDPRVTWPMQRSIQAAGGQPVISKSGHSYFKSNMPKHNAIFGAEMSSHFFYKELYNADSGMLTIAYMLKFLYQGLDFTADITKMYEQFPNSGEVNYIVDNIPTILEKLEAAFKDGRVEKVDGLSIEFDDWRFNLRGSNTQPLLRLNVESSSKQKLIEKFKDIEQLIGGTRDNIPALMELR